MKAILVDDENNAIEVLLILLKEYCKQIEIIGVANGGEQAVELIRKLNPDVVFLDIAMPHKNGFEVLMETKDCNYQTIFTTAFDEYAIQAFKVAAVDYLLKPIDADELINAVSKLKTSNSSNTHVVQMVDDFMQNRNIKIALPLGDAYNFYLPSEIVRCESDSNYTHIYFANSKRITVAKTLKDIDENLKGLGFVRIHQSHLINRDFIKGMSRGDAGFVILNDDTRLPVSRSKKDSFFESIRKL